MPTLPRGLATVLELRASILRRLGTRLCHERGAVPAAPLPRVEPLGFSRDGFHASAEGYAYVAAHLSGYVLGDRFMEVGAALAGFEESESPAPAA